MATGVLPFPDWRMQASVWLMNVHQVLVFGFILMPLFYYSERAFGVHSRRFGLKRAAARLPVVAAVMLVATAFPFYGGFNALFAAIGVPSLSFAIPCYLYNKTYLFSKSNSCISGENEGGESKVRTSLWARAAAARAAAPHPPPRLFGLLSSDSAWKLALVLNAVLGTCFTVAGSGAGIFFSVEDMVAQASKWGVFASRFSFFDFFFFDFSYFFTSLSPFSNRNFTLHTNETSQNAASVCSLPRRASLQRERERERERER